MATVQESIKKDLTTTTTDSSKRFVIVGGGGYIGYHVGLDLHKKGHQVLLMDLSEPDPEWVSDSDIRVIKLSDTDDKNVYTDEGMGFLSGSVTLLQDLEKAFTFADCVILCASYGMSGREQMPSEWDKTEEINVTGVKNVIKACCSQGVSSLVYTSTFNVVFGGQEIKNGDESLPYFPLHRHVDHYSRTKSVAEQLVLMSDLKQLTLGHNEHQSHGHLRTCALRLAGVMGLKEKRHLPRIVRTLPFLKFRYGYGSGLVQFVSLSNVVQAHVKASLEILKRPNVIGGQAYFISDGEPINNFEYFKPLIERLGYSYPKRVAPMWLIWIFAYLCQISHSFVTRLNPRWTFNPLLTPAEVYKTAVTHYFSIEKANRDFEFLPEKPNDLREVTEYFYKKGNPGVNLDGKSRLSILEYLELGVYLVLTVFMIVGYFVF